MKICTLLISKYWVDSTPCVCVKTWVVCVGDQSADSGYESVRWWMLNSSLLNCRHIWSPMQRSWGVSAFFLWWAPDSCAHDETLLDAKINLPWSFSIHMPRFVCVLLYFALLFKPSSLSWCGQTSLFHMNSQLGWQKSPNMKSNQLRFLLLIKCQSTELVVLEISNIKSKELSESWSKNNDSLQLPFS